MEKRKGGCHCDLVRYEAEIDLTKSVIECNCSICAGKGLLLAFVPEDKVVIESGEESLTEYRFNTDTIAHLFCKVCGMQSFAKAVDPEGNPTYAINVRTIDDVDLDALTRMPYDGKAR